MDTSLINTNDVKETIRPERVYALVSVSPQVFTAIAVLFFVSFFTNYLLLLLPLLFAIVATYKYQLILSYNYHITEQQLITEKGIFNKTVNYLEMYRIKDIIVNQPFWMKAAGLMNVTLLSFDSNEPVIIIKGIKVSSLPQVIRNHVQVCRLKNKVLTVDN